MSRPRFLVPPGSLQPGTLAIKGPELHHLRVRRLGPGSEITVSDGAGEERHGTIVAVGQERALVELSPATDARTDPALALSIAVALIKPARQEVLLEKATELGVTEFIFLETERSIGTVSTTRLGRWQRIAAAAAKQSERRVIPALHPSCSLDTFLQEPRPGARLLLCERAPVVTAAGLGRPPSPLQATVLIGPPGGLSAAEREQALRADYRPIGLSSRILRSETAGLAAAALLPVLWPGG